MCWKQYIRRKEKAMNEHTYHNYSVLMSVYYREKPEYLKQAIESIQQQTLPTDDFVLVCDGPLTPELDAVIEEKERVIGEGLHVVRLAENVGLGKALNAGIQHCRHELVARMDSDDISYPDRCEKQLAVFRAHPEVSICSGTVEEFSVSPEIVESRRIVPQTHDEIMAFARTRNPFNHPCVMYKKAAVEAIGSYQHFYLLEDYYLWVRMLTAGFRGYNLQEPVLHMRAGSEMYRRRSGWKYAKSQERLFRFMLGQGLIGKGQYVRSCIIRGASSLLPNWLRKWVYETRMREKKRPSSGEHR